MNYICALDLGGYQFKLLIASIDETGELEILGGTKKVCNAIKGGKVINLKEATDTLKDCFEEVVNLSGLKEKEISHYFVNITGEDIKGYDGTLNNVITIDHRDKRITKGDIESVIQNSDADGLYEKSCILHKIPRYYSIDNTPFIKNPVGLEGQKLSVNSYIIATSKYQISNLNNVIYDSLGVREPIFVLNSLASAETVISDDQKKLGVIMIDIGGENVDIAAYSDESLLFASSFIGGGKEITLDIAKDFSLNLDTAEKLKVEFERIVLSGKNTIVVETIGGAERQIRVPNIKKNIVEKFNSIFGNIYNKLQYYMEQEKFSAGIVITGGGAMAYEMLDIASSHFPLIIQIGQVEHTIPGIENIDITPEFSTVIGLILWGRSYIVEKKRNLHIKSSNGIDIITRIKKWFREFKE